MDEIDEGHRLHPPPGCPRMMYQLMMECWYVYFLLVTTCNCYIKCALVYHLGTQIVLVDLPLKLLHVDYTKTLQSCSSWEHLKKN